MIQFCRFFISELVRTVHAFAKRPTVTSIFSQTVTLQMSVIKLFFSKAAIKFKNCAPSSLL